MTAAGLAILAAVAISLANGANDNGKGIATLAGAGVFSERKARWLGHLATVAGAVLSIYISKGLIRAFQGHGLLPQEAVGQAAVLAIVGTAAAVTVGLATLIRMPVSTTHALTGGLVGVGLGKFGMVYWGGLLTKFALPLLASPLLAALFAAGIYRLMHRLRLAMHLTEESCVCVCGSRRWVPVTALRRDASSLGMHLSLPQIHVSDAASCRRRYQGNVVGVSAAALLDGVHIASATLISAARGVNDTPKLAALAVGSFAWSSGGPAVAMVAAAMFLGGVFAAKGVTRRMSNEITEMNAGSAATANLVAVALVASASLWALPVSTTHVTCGGLFGIGMAQGTARWRMIGTIALSWLTTVPLAAAIAVAIAMVW